MVQPESEDVAGSVVPAAAPSAAAPVVARPASGAPRADGRTTRWADHRATRTLELVRAARRCVHEQGPDVSMDDLAAHMGTSKSILYRYFTDKAGLQRAVGQHVLQRILRELTEAAGHSGGPRERIHAMVAAYLRLVDDAPHVYAFVTSPTAEASGDVRGFVAEVDVIVARTLVPAVLGLDDDSQVDRISPATATRATLWASGVTGTVRSVADRWLAARAEIESRSDDAERPAADPVPGTTPDEADATAGRGSAVVPGTTNDQGDVPAGRGSAVVPGPSPDQGDPTTQRGGVVGGLPLSEIDDAVAGIERDELAAFIASWLWDGAVGVLRRARTDTRPRTVPTTKTDKDVS
ncbi:TetR/AcrR family transcriptional regulator [Georgenia sp. Z1344]|uniref:TetR/AcrR family transcriptional regulator n=1 Tax=Georgenia sp. Z1344 TaxID=3416706 RepID=UPI003CF41D0C